MFLKYRLSGIKTAIPEFLSRIRYIRFKVLFKIKIKTKTIHFVLLKDRSRSEELTLINHQNEFFVFLRDQMPKFQTMPFIRGLKDLTGSKVDLNLQNPGISSPERGIKYGHPRLL